MPYLRDRANGRLTRSQTVYQMRRVHHGADWPPLGCGSRILGQSVRVQSHPAARFEVWLVSTVTLPVTVPLFCGDWKGEAGGIPLIATGDRRQLSSLTYELHTSRKFTGREYSAAKAKKNLWKR